MKEVTDIDDLEPGKYYYLFKKQDEEYIGIQKLKSPCGKYLNAKFFADGGSLSDWYVFGGVENGALLCSLDELRYMCEYEPDNFEPDEHSTVRFIRFTA